ncbi:MAG: HD domain-containing protein [Elusimicrobiota bacterium]
MKRAHRGQKDLGGKPYWKHPVRVMALLGRSASIAEKHAALLHDVIEDTKTTFDDLKKAGFRPDVLAAVKLLTRVAALTYKRYIKRLIDSGNTAAMRVKLADLTDNMSRNRIIPDAQRHLRLLSRHQEAEKQIGRRLRQNAKSPSI